MCNLNDFVIIKKEKRKKKNLNAFIVSIIFNLKKSLANAKEGLASRHRNLFKISFFLDIFLTSMTIIARIPFQPFTPNTKPDSKFVFTSAGLSLFQVGFPKNREFYRLLWVDDSGEMEWIKRLGSGWFVGCCSKKGRTIEIESLDGGEDIFDAAAAAEPMALPDHLVIMVNGLVGRYN